MIEREMLSPKQLIKRQQIVNAAKAILLRDGPAGCSSREVARESGMNKGLIHYYFENVEEIIDAAMTDLFGDLAAAISQAGHGHTDPADRFWAVLEEYLGVFDRRPGLSLLWFEYWTMVTRDGRVEKVERLQEGLIELLTDLLAEAGVDDAPARARVILSYVLGVLVRFEIHPQTFNDLRPEIESLARMQRRQGRC